jgi:hypothetical protein
MGFGFSMKKMEEKKNIERFTDKIAEQNMFLKD